MTVVSTYIAFESLVKGISTRSFMSSLAVPKRQVSQRFNSSAQDASSESENIDKFELFIYYTRRPFVNSKTYMLDRHTGLQLRNFRENPAYIHTSPFVLACSSLLVTIITSTMLIRCAACYHRRGTSSSSSLCCVLPSPWYILFQFRAQCLAMPSSRPTPSDVSRWCSMKRSTSCRKSTTYAERRSFSFISSNFAMLRHCGEGLVDSECYWTDTNS